MTAQDNECARQNQQHRGCEQGRRAGNMRDLVDVGISADQQFCRIKVGGIVLDKVPGDLGNETLGLDVAD